jgi:uncharacterized SAM-dependent methyltransferase
MSYYDTNTEIANTFNVSKTTVSRWLEGSVEGRNNLIVEKRDKKVYVLKNEHNYAEMLKLKEEGIKYRASTSYVEVSPKQEFYEVFNESQQIEIINNLELRKEILHKYTYINGGAGMWDVFYTKSMTSGTYLTPFRVMNLLENNFDYIEYKIKRFDKVNIIEVGPGNGKPIKDFLDRLNKANKLNSYVALDISQNMCEIVERNIKDWFPNILVKYYICDIENYDISKVLFESKYNHEPDESVINIVMYLGSTIGTHRDIHTILRNFSNGMTKDDLLIVSNTLDTTKNRSGVGFAKSEDSVLQNSWIPKWMGINISHCEFETKYDSYQGGWKTLYFKPDQDYCINFNFSDISRKVYLAKGEEIIVWRHKMSVLKSLIQDFEATELQPIQLSLENDLSYIFAVCQAANN